MWYDDHMTKDTDTQTRATTLIEFLEGEIAGIKTEIERVREDPTLVDSIRFVEYIENFVYGMGGLDVFTDPDEFADSIHAED